MCTYSLSSPGEKGVVFLRKDSHFIARLRCVLKCETIFTLIQGTSSSLKLAMGSWVLRLVDVFPSAAPRNTSTPSAPHTGRAPSAPPNPQSECKQGNGPT